MRRVEFALAIPLALVLGLAGSSTAAEQQARPRNPAAAQPSRSSGQSQSAVRSSPAPRSAPARAAVPRVSRSSSAGEGGVPARQSGSRIGYAPAAESARGQATQRHRPSSPPPDSRYSRPRDGRYPTGQAAQRPAGYYPGYRPGYGYRPPYYRPPYYGWGGGWYYPWGFGAWGLSYGYGYPGWGWGGYYGYYGPSYAYVYSDIGSIRVMVKPRDAHVYVDGYYVGIVDEFDGTFQRLELPEGPHRIEVRSDGFATLTFDVRVIVNHTIKLRGALQPMP